MKALFTGRKWSHQNSVYYACTLHRIVGRFFKADMVKDWLRLPPTIKGEDGDNIQHISQPLGASLAAVIIASAPFAMVKVSIFSFLLGFAIYQGFIFTKDLDPDAGPYDSRNNFITLVVSTGVFRLFFLVTFSAKDIENMIRFYIEPKAAINLEVQRDQDADSSNTELGLQDVLAHRRAVRKGIHGRWFRSIDCYLESLYINPLTFTRIHVGCLPDSSSSFFPRGIMLTPKSTTEPGLVSEPPPPLFEDSEAASETQSSKKKNTTDASQSTAGTPTTGLAAALEAAARSHALCAQADQRLAVEYSRLSRI